MKIFSNHRRKLEPYRRFGGREFKEKLANAKNYKRSFGPKENPLSGFFASTGLSKIGTLAGVAVLGTVFYFVCVSHYFWAGEIRVSGASQVSADEISAVINNLSQKRFFLVPENSLLFLSPARANSILTKAEPVIESVKVKRTWPDKISFEITERTPALVLSSGGTNYLIDDQGFVIKQVGPETTLMEINDSVQEDIPVGSTLGGKLIPFVLSMQSQWPSKVQVPLSSAKIPGKGSTEVEFISAEGWSVFFSTDRPVTSQLANLSGLLAHQIGANRVKLAYVDLRLAKWAYFCLKDTPCQQTDQTQADSQTAATAITASPQTGSDASAPATNPPALTPK